MRDVRRGGGFCFILGASQVPSKAPLTCTGHSVHGLALDATVKVHPERQTTRDALTVNQGQTLAQSKTRQRGKKNATHDAFPRKSSLRGILKIANMSYVRRRPEKCRESWKSCQLTQVCSRTRDCRKRKLQTDKGDREIRRQRRNNG